MVEIGQKVTCEPAFAGSDTPGPGRKQRHTGRVVYIHPGGRFYIVEFQTPKGPVREAFLMTGGGADAGFD